MALNLLLGWEVGRRLPGRFGLAGLGWPELTEVGLSQLKTTTKTESHVSTSVIFSRSDFSLTNEIFSFQTPGIETFEAAAHPRQYSSHSGNSDAL